MARWAGLQHPGGRYWPKGLAWPMADVAALLQYAMGEDAAARDVISWNGVCRRPTSPRMKGALWQTSSSRWTNHRPTTAGF